MSAGGHLANGLVPDHDVSRLAPKMQEAVSRALVQCAAAGYDAMVEEAGRTQALQETYWHRGRPPTEEWPEVVTHAANVLDSWHGYYLAVDVISRSRHWFAPRPIIGATPAALAEERLRSRREAARFYEGIAPIFKAAGLRWGGDWQPPKQDRPHFQWGRCKPSPSPRAKLLYQSGGLAAVWLAVGAL